MRRKPCAFPQGRRSGSGIEEVVIVASIPGSSAEVGSEVVQLDRADLEAKAFVTVSDAIRTLPQVFGGGPTKTDRRIEARTNVMRGSGINLRGLAAGSTL